MRGHWAAMVFKPQFIKRLGCREIPQWQDGCGVDLGGTWWVWGDSGGSEFMRMRSPYFFYMFGFKEKRVLNTMFDNQKSITLCSSYLSVLLLLPGREIDVKLFQKTYTQVTREKERGEFIESAVGSPRTLRRTYNNMDWVGRRPDTEELPRAAEFMCIQSSNPTRQSSCPWSTHLKSPGEPENLRWVTCQCGTINKGQGSWGSKVTAEDWPL